MAVNTSDILDDLERAKSEMDDDAYHHFMRIRSCIIFDLLLEDCSNGNCPEFTNDERLLSCLTDISLANYIKTKAYYYHEEDVFLGYSYGDKYYYYLAEKQIKKVLNCSINPSINCSIFNIDTEQISDDHEYYESARRRKAYWSYLSYKPNNNHMTDYCGACYFIDTLHGLSNKKKTSMHDYTKAKKLLCEDQYKNIANALDLFRTCVIRTNII